jgi:hypothetical protein
MIPSSYRRDRDLSAGSPRWCVVNRVAVGFVVLSACDGHGNYYSIITQAVPISIHPG